MIRNWFGLIVVMGMAALVASWPVPSLQAGVWVFLDTEHDDSSVRLDCLEQPAIVARGDLIRKLERKIIDRLMTRGRLESRFQPGQKLTDVDVVRPIGADDVMSLEGLRRADVAGLEDRATFYEMKNGLGGIYVFFGADGKPFPDCAIYWKVDQDLPRLTNLNQCQARLQWEQRRWESLLRLMCVTEVQLSVSLDEYPWIPDR